MPETEYSLQWSVINRHAPFQGRLLIPNITSRFGEMDVLLLSKAGYTTEFEIKISRSDFSADKNKQFKHQSYSAAFEGKSELFEQGNGFMARNIRWIPNYFIYVVAESMNAATLKVPEYAGLYQIKNGWLETIKVAPKIHKEKHKEFWTHVIAQSLNAKYWYHHFSKKD